MRRIEKNPCSTVGYFYFQVLLVHTEKNSLSQSIYEPAQTFFVKQLAWDSIKCTDDASLNNSLANERNW